MMMVNILCRPRDRQTAIEREEEAAVDSKQKIKGRKSGDRLGFVTGAESSFAGR